MKFYLVTMGNTIVIETTDYTAASRLKANVGYETQLDVPVTHMKVLKPMGAVEIYNEPYSTKNVTINLRDVVAVMELDS